MHKKSKKPLLKTTHLPLILLGSVMAGYGLLVSLVAGWYANQAMQGNLSPGDYRSGLAAFEQIAGLLAGIGLLVFFIWCAIVSGGIVRAAFIIGSVSALAPVLAPLAESLLFDRLGLPTLSAGSVLAGAVTTLLFALPLVISFILLACGRRVLRSIRWIALVSVFVVLFTAIFPIYVTLLAFLMKPGDPAVGQMMEMSAQVIKLRYILPGLVYLIMAWISMRFANHQPWPEAQPTPAPAS